MEILGYILLSIFFFFLLAMYFDLDEIYERIYERYKNLFDKFDNVLRNSRGRQFGETIVKDINNYIMYKNSKFTQVVERTDLIPVSIPEFKQMIREDKLKKLGV